MEKEERKIMEPVSAAGLKLVQIWYNILYISVKDFILSLSNAEVRTKLRCSIRNNCAIICLLKCCMSGSGRNTSAASALSTNIVIQ